MKGQSDSGELVQGLTVKTFTRPDRIRTNTVPIVILQDETL